MSLAPTPHAYSSHRYFPIPNTSAQNSLYAPIYFPSDVPAAGAPSAAGTAIPSTGKYQSKIDTARVLGGGSEEKVQSSVPCTGELLCVCERCSCGLHKCPATPQLGVSGEPGNFSSTTADTYRKHAHYGAPRARGVDNGKSSIPFDSNPDYGPGHSKSLSATDFRPPSRSSVRKPVPPPVDSLQFLDASAPLGSNTLYRSEYIQHPLATVKSCKPAQAAFFQPGESFDGQTNNRENYKDFLAQGFRPEKPFRPQHAVNSAQPEDRNFLTDHGENYTRKQFSARQAAAKPSDLSVNSFSFSERDEKFPTGTENNEKFQNWSGRGRAAALMKPAKTIQDKEDEDRTFLSTKQADYTRHSYKMPGKAALNAFAASNSAIFPDERFVGESMSKSSYRPFPGAKSAEIWHPQGVSLVGGEENRDFTTNYNQEFQSKGAACNRPLTQRPVGNFEVSDEDREFQTENRSQLRKFPYSVRENFKPAQNSLGPNGGIFQGESEKNSSYRFPQGGRAAAMIRPQIGSSLGSDEENRHFVSEHAFHYQAKRIPPCPALSLPERTYKDRSGHLYYQVDENTGKFVKTKTTRGAGF